MEAERKYSVVYFSIVDSKEHHYRTNNYEEALRVGENKASLGYLPVYILDNETEEVVLDI